MDAIQFIDEKKSYLIKANGIVIAIRPKRRKYFSLKELQDYVDGYIEIVRLPISRILIINEEGLLRHLPNNRIASMLAGAEIVGNVVLCNSQQVK